MAKEIWKMHPCGLEVSNMGRVKVPKSGKNPEHFTFGNTNNYGYKRIQYKGKSYRVHRLVAECFLDNLEGKETVDHINCVKTDNRVENLRFASRVEQLNFTDQDVKERMAKKQSKPVLQCDLDGNVVHMWSSTQECGRNGYNQGNVSECCNGKRKKHRGFRWKYA